MVVSSTRADHLPVKYGSTQLQQIYAYETNDVIFALSVINRTLGLFIKHLSTFEELGHVNFALGKDKTCLLKIC